MKLIILLALIGTCIQAVTCVCPTIIKSNGVLKPSGYWKLQETGAANIAILNSGSQGGSADGQFRSTTPDFLEQTGNNHDCVVGKCYQFDATASDGIEIKWIDGFSNSKSFSIAAWVYVTDSTNNNFKSIMTNRHHYGPTNRQAGFAFYLNGAEQPQLYLAAFNAGTGTHGWITVTSPVSCEQDRWNYVVTTFDFDSKVAKMYLNGIMVKQLTMSGVHTYTPALQNAGRDSMFIGSGGDIGDAFPFKGRIDEVRYFLYSLEEKQIRKLFDKQQVLLASKPDIHLTFEDTPGTGNSLINYGYANIGNPTFGTSTINSKANCEHNKCVEITGGNNNIILPLKAGVSDTTVFTLSVWVRANEINRKSTIYDTYECCADRKGMMLQFATSNSLVFTAGKGGSNSYTTTISHVPVIKDDWMHIAVTYNSASFGGEFTFYVNGAFVRRARNQVYVPQTIANGFIGNRLSGLEPMKGYIDEFAYYTRALSLAEIQLLVWKAVPFLSVGIRHMVAGSKFQFTVTFNSEVVSLAPANFEFFNQQEAVVDSVTKVTDLKFNVIVSYPKKHAKKKRNLGPTIYIRVASFSNVGPTCEMDGIRGLRNGFSISFAPPAPHPTNDFDLFLAIMAAGGDGISGAFIGGGYSVVDGSFLKQMVNDKFSLPQVDCEDGNKQFSKVTSSLGGMVDGVGIMDGTAAAVATKITSSSVTFKFADTKFQSNQFCGTYNPVSSFNVGAGSSDGNLLTAGGNVNYYVAEKYSLYMHPNKFITFNLDHIRKYHSVAISSIKADVGASQSSCSGNAVAHNVLVDGVSKYYKEQKKSDVLISLDIPITIDDKFLTIASHGIDDGNCLQSVFGNLKATSKACVAVPSPLVWNGAGPAVFQFSGCYNIFKTPGMAVATGGTITSVTSVKGTEPYHTWVVSVTPHTAKKRQVEMVGSVCMFGICGTFGLASASGSGDPHFIGLNNVHFDVFPKTASFYNLLSTNNLEINSKFDFIQMVPNIRSSGTYMTEIGIQLPNYNISVSSTDSNEYNVPSSTLTLNGKVYQGAITNSPSQPSTYLINKAGVKAIWSHKNESNEEAQLSWKGRFVDEFTIEIDNTIRIIILSAEDGYKANSKSWVSYPRRYLAIEIVVLDEAPLIKNGMYGIIGRTFRLPAAETNNFNYSDYQLASLWN